MEELSRQFKAGEINEKQLKEAARDMVKGYGKDIGIDYEVVYLDESTMPKDAKESTGSAYILDEKNRKVLIPIDVNKIKDTGDLFGTLTEEVSHGKDALEGRQDKKVAEDETNKEEGLESLGKPANDYVKNKLGDNSSDIQLSTDGIDLTNADVGEKIGDYMSPEDLKYRKYYREEVLPYDENYQNFLRTILSMGLDFSPLGVIKGVTEGIVGYDIVTGEKLDLATRIIGAIPIANDIYKSGRRGVKLLKSAKKVETVLADGSKVVLNVDTTIKTTNKVQAIISSSGTTEVIDKTTDITKASKNIKKVNEVSEDITKEVKIIDKSNDVDKIAKNTRKMKLIKNEQTLDDIFTKKNSEDF